MPAPRIPRDPKVEDGDNPESIQVVPGLLQDQLALLREELQGDVMNLAARLHVIEAHLGLHAKHGQPSQQGHEAEVLQDQNQVSPACGAMQQEVKAAKPHPPHPIGPIMGQQKAEESTEVCFEASVWSVPLLIGVVDVGWFDNVFAAMLVLLNFGMQTAFTYVLLSDGFMGESLEKDIESAKIWRTSVAHDAKYLDLADTSLVSRVCNGDGALILSTTQAILVNHINDFLGLEKTQLDHSLFQPGTLLCLLCIVLWSLCIYKDQVSVVSAECVFLFAHACLSL